MRTQCETCQRGQATTEFIAATALFIPLFLAVIYCGKYADIKHQAIQASRYAAMQRALDPRAHLADPTVEAGTVARFFRDGGTHDIGFDDQAQGATTGDENPNWGLLNGDPLIAQYSDIEVKLGTKSVSSLWLAPIDLETKLFNDLNESSATEADVRVKVANIPNFPLLDNINLVIRATTVIAGNTWDAGGATDVKNHIDGLAVPASALKIINNIPGIDQVFELLAGAPAPKIGCVKADVVPDKVAPGASYQASDPCN